MATDATPRMQQLRLDDRDYRLEVLRQVEQPSSAPRLIVVSLVPTPEARDLLDACLRAIRHFTTIPYELWVVDHNSPREHADWLLMQSGINVVLNRTEPLPPAARGTRWPWQRHRQQTWGSYANAVALELAIRLIDPATRAIMPLHMDTMPCAVHWLQFLLSKLGRGTAAAGVRMDTYRVPEGVLHVLGYLVDFQLFRRLGLDFMPQLPRLDVGDRVTVALRDAGYGVFACRNTLWEPGLIETIPAASPFRELRVDRAFDDEGNVIFLHLGRGIRKATGAYSTGTLPSEWVRVARERLLR